MAGCVATLGATDTTVAAVRANVLQPALTAGR
jgi:hypothetical protein